MPADAALLWTLSTGLGEAVTPDVEEAWTSVYTTLSGARTSFGAARCKAG